jgi:hypothetical protein
METTNGAKQMLLNIFGGIIVALLTLVGRWLFYKLVARRFSQIFQNNINDEFHVIYKSSMIDRNAVLSTPQSIVPRNTPRTTNLSVVNSCSTTRSIGHLVYEFGKSRKRVPLIKSDIETDQKIDISFISLGGTTNRKTMDLLSDSSNEFLDYQNGAIIAKNSKAPLIQDNAEDGFDYAFIIKIHPQTNSSRTWICCGGIGEWGQSGSAWYLANRWTEIRNFAKNKQFAFITKTRIGIDDSTVAIHKFRSGKEVEDAAANLASQ